MQQGQKPLASNAAAPDLDWSQVTETVRMLNLAVAQIVMAMHEGDDSVDSLSNAFTSMVDNVNQVAGVAAALDQGANIDGSKAEILARCETIQQGMSQSIVAFQFYDRLSQRLDHVRHALEQLSGLVANKERLFNPEEWNGLQTAIRSRYTMQEEQDMFEALLHGASIDEALESVKQRLQDGDIDDIELF